MESRTAERVGERLRLLRVARGLKQRELGEKVGGRSAMTISDYERGRSQINGDDLRDFAQALGVPATAFFESHETFMARCGELFSYWHDHENASADKLSIQLDLFGVVAPFTPSTTQAIALAASA